MKRSEFKKLESISQLNEILKENDVSNSPVYTGFGVEIYENLSKKVQVVVNMRDDESALVIHRGF